MTSNALISSPSLKLAGSLLRVSADKYHQMIDQGIIEDGATIELLDGLIVNKDRSILGEDPMSHSPLHRLAVRRLIKLAARIDSARRQCQIQLPVRLSDFDEPEPDAAVVLGADDDFKSRLPGPADVACVIESAHSSLDRDREYKLGIYSKAGIGQYVIVNLRMDCVEVHSDPDIISGTFRTKATARRGERVKLSLGGGEILDVAAEEMLP